METNRQHCFSRFFCQLLPLPYEINEIIGKHVWSDARRRYLAYNCPFYVEPLSVFLWELVDPHIRFTFTYEIQKRTSNILGMSTTTYVCSGFTYYNDRDFMDLYRHSVESLSFYDGEAPLHVYIDNTKDYKK